MSEKTAEFISRFGFYDLEESGAKPYTIRDNTPRTKAKLEGAAYIRIRRGYTSRSFTRKISHILEWGDFIIISWNERLKTLEDASKTLRNSIVRIVIF